MSSRRLIVAGMSIIGLACLVLLFKGGLGGPKSKETGLVDIPAAELGLPPEFVRRVQDRAVLDICQYQLHATDRELLPAPRPPSTANIIDGSFIQIRAPSWPPDVLAYRRSLPDNRVPMRGFRAPLFQDVAQFRPASIEKARGDKAELRAAGVIQEKLASDGLLLNLARALEAFGSAYWKSGATNLIDKLQRVGFPVDLIACFGPIPSSMPNADSLVSWIAGQLTAGQTLDDLRSQLSSIPFRFLKSLPNYEVATEAGEHRLGLLRLQLGGGYREGIIPGGTLDLTVQLVKALPDVDFLMSVPEEVSKPLEWTCRHQMAWVRPGQLTLVVEPLSLSAWAQDNGKAGTRTINSKRSWATLVPRYASKGEGDSTLLPGDTFAAEGLVAAGHEVAQSRLLFQGGNLLAWSDPQTGRRFLLLGEAELHRNVALGLSRAQALQAFQTEFGVDACVVLSAVSFHIDFDVSIRTQDDGAIAFVNDPLSAARLILRTGAAALQRAGHLSEAGLAAIRSAGSDQSDRTVFETLAPIVYGQLNKQGQFPAALAQSFASTPQDAPSENLRIFLVALEVVGSHVLTGRATPQDPTMRSYLEALQRLHEAVTRQVNELRKLPLRIVPLPSMPDLTPSLNYLNGIHDPTRFLIPVSGGFYSEVDDAVLRIVRDTLGPKVKVIPFISGESQRQHGAVHCAAAAYPRLTPAPSAGD